MLLDCLQIKTTAQLDAAFSFFSHTGSESFKIHEFEEACGVGMQSTAIRNEFQLNIKISNLFICCFGMHVVVSACFGSLIQAAKHCAALA